MSDTTRLMLGALCMLCAGAASLYTSHHAEKESMRRRGFGAAACGLTHCMFAFAAGVFTLIGAVVLVASIAMAVR